MLVEVVMWRLVIVIVPFGHVALSLHMRKGEGGGGLGAHSCSSYKN